MMKPDAEIGALAGGERKDGRLRGGGAGRRDRAGRQHRLPTQPRAAAAAGRTGRMPAWRGAVRVRRCGFAEAMRRRRICRNKEVMTGSARAAVMAQARPQRLEQRESQNRRQKQRQPARRSKPPQPREKRFCRLVAHGRTRLLLPVCGMLAAGPGPAQVII